jgi:hypothetical protein
MDKRDMILFAIIISGGIVAGTISYQSNEHSHIQAITKLQMNCTKEVKSE